MGKYNLSYRKYTYFFTQSSCRNGQFTVFLLTVNDFYLFFTFTHHYFVRCGFAFTCVLRFINTRKMKNLVTIL